MSDRWSGTEVVVDASVLVDLLAATEHHRPVRQALEGRVLHAPMHLDVEVLSALGRLNRAGHLSVTDVDDALQLLTVAPITRHEVTSLLGAAWAMRDAVRLTDALYLTLAEMKDLPLLTTDQRLARVSSRAVFVADSR